MSYRYVNANDVVDIVDMETQNRINEMDCVYIDGIKPNNQHFNLSDHDKQIRDEVIEEIKSKLFVSKPKEVLGVMICPMSMVLDDYKKLFGDERRTEQQHISEQLKEE